MENAFRSDFSPQNERGEELVIREEKSQQEAYKEATGQTRPHFKSLEEVHAYYQALDRAKDKKLNPKDYFDIDHIKEEIEDFTLCCLDLARILDQPVDNDGMMSVRFTYASEKIHNAQISALDLAHFFYQIQDYFDDLNKMGGRQ